ncbi:MAG: bifunctional molybdopterin-guanine dinucleotide biosynthesis adaptor protein MobB/molybdopterin molybdotransferase MoeA, partial [Shewanella sp.]
DLNNVSQIADFVMQYAKDWQAPCVQLPIQPVAASVLSHDQNLSVSQGLGQILSHVVALAASEEVALDASDNRVLAKDSISPINVPQQTNSAMDGYAFCYQAPMPKALRRVGEVLAGHQYAAALNPGETVRIMTGAPLPLGADTVQPRELACEADGKVTLEGPIAKGQHVRLAGEDIAKGAIALTKGTRLGAAEQGLLASLGLDKVSVQRRPRVAVFSTGDEVSAPGAPLKANCIYDSNRFTITAMATRLGCEVIDLGIIEDSEAALEAALTQGASQADVVISSGGVSVGDADYIKTVLARLGSIDFWRINMRPGRPLAFGNVADSLFFGLPGNPVAVMVSFLQFVQPALRKLAGELNWQPQFIPAISDEQLSSRLGRTEFIRGTYHLGADGRLHVRSTGNQGSGMLSSMVKGNCLIILGEDAHAANAGDTVFIQPFADLL